MKKKRSFNIFRLGNISQKIIFGFLIIYFFFIANAIISLLTLNQSDNIIEESSEVVNPSIEMIEDFILMVTESKSYTISWVYVRSNTGSQDKVALEKIHADYPEFKDKLFNLIPKWTNENLRSEIDSVFISFEQMKNAQKSIMQQLVDYEDYESTAKLKAEKTLDEQVLPLANKVLSKLNLIVDEKKKERHASQQDLLNSSAQLRQVTIILGSVLILLGFGVNFWTRYQIVNPIKYINTVFIKLGQGELPEDKHTKFNSDEIGEMAASADRLVNSLRATSAFAQNIGQGNYQAEYEPLSDKDVLGNALIEMRNNLAKLAEEDRIRSWSTEGLVQFSELLKQNKSEDDSLQALSDRIISSLVKYVNANQGGLFIVENESESENGTESEPFMRLASCYAWDKQKYLERKIYQGDGLAGQAWQEHATIYTNEVPDNYVEITSGLGGAQPSHILIVPLKLNEDVFGVVELASFQEFKPYEREFVEKVAENIASSIATVEINERTKKLLQESNDMTEQMRSQEEEMRQNMEELQSTQEHIERAQKEAQEREALINITSIVIETDRKFNIKQANELAEAKLKYEAKEFDGMAIDYLFENFDMVEKGKSWLEKDKKWIEFTYLKGKDGQKLFVKLSAAAIKNQKGRTSKYLFLFDDISEASS